MRKDVQEIFRSTPHEKQVMMFSATLSKEIRPVCKKFMQDVGTTLFRLNLSPHSDPRCNEETKLANGVLLTKNSSCSYSNIHWVEERRWHRRAEAQERRYEGRVGGVLIG